MAKILKIVCLSLFRIRYIQKLRYAPPLQTNKKERRRTKMPPSILLLCSPISFCGYCIILRMYLPPPLAQFRGYNTDAMLSESFSQKKKTKKKEKKTRRQAPYTLRPPCHSTIRTKNQPSRLQILRVAKR